MKGSLTIKNQAGPLTLQDFTEESFLFEGKVYIVVFNGRKDRGVKCLNVSESNVVLLPYNSTIIPLNIEVTAT